MTRINSLFDFYEPLLTEKQQTFLKYYFHDDFSLGEIAAEFGISRQAVYEHIKRAEQVLESYESKLGLLSKHLGVQALIESLESQVLEWPEAAALPSYRQQLMNLIDQLRSVEHTGKTEVRHHGGI
ncbi:YlxM family DNA-binding protein [Paenibacillus sp. GCM10023252]|uniref:YlxM family DNA-binding protein n=1 Tax=Paenibacillus sp. GCM10023252 TaxID=3252649 RepID=UPI003620A7EE